MRLDKSILFELLSCPTAPFRESLVASFVTRFLEDEKVPFFFDPVGNIVVGVKSKIDYLKTIENSRKEPVRLFIAHMDHPGFHGVRWSKDNLLEVKWHGGTPRKFIEGAKVWLGTNRGELGEGIVQKANLNPTKSALESSEIWVEKWDGKQLLKKIKPKDLFGAFSFRAPVWENKKNIYTKAADDLVGVFTILSLAKSLKNKNRPFMGLISRAEEVGFIGTIGHLALGWLDGKTDSVVVVSLETSRTLPGALIGKGPIVRLGDRATPFDPAYTQLLTELANKILPGKFQRRIMDGGTCEATAALAFGFRAIGISVPLGNYHNQSFEGGPDARGEWGPAPEFVNIDDIEGMLDLCGELMRAGHAWADPWKKKRQTLLKLKSEAKQLLKLR